MLRVRWSGKAHAFLVEQKIGRAALPPAFVHSEDDDAIRSRDGYGLVMEIQPGDRMPCPLDGTTLRVPHLRTSETVCPECRRQGRDGRFKAAYYPFGSALMEHLRSLDPRKGRQLDVMAAVDKSNRRRELAQERHLSNEVESITKDNFGRMVGIPQFGYGGQGYTWNK